MDSMDSIVPVLEGTQPSRPSWSRRSFVMTSLATGFALAVQPVSAETITTDTNGLAAGEVKVPVKGGEIPAYRAMPANGGPFPTVLVASEVWGVHEHIKDICRRLAKAGYFAIAPELFTRQGDPSKIADTQEIIAKIVKQAPTEQVMSDLDATVAYAKSAGKADVARLAVTGFCARDHELACRAADRALYLHVHADAWIMAQSHRGLLLQAGAFGAAPPFMFGRRH